MDSIPQRLLRLLRNVAPSVITPPAYEAALHHLGLDSFALVALLMDVEDEFSIPVEAMREHLHKRCTFGELVRLCDAHAARESLAA